MRPQPLVGEAALVAGDTLVVSDLHIGLEYELKRAGYFVPSRAGKMADRLRGAAEATGAARLVVVGDLKHKVSDTSPLERRDLPRFFESVRGSFEEVHVVLGNHDAGLRAIAPRWVRFHSPQGWREDDLAFCHGHTWPAARAMGARILVMGHVHPVVRLADRLGAPSTLPCWVRAPFAGGGGRYRRVPRELIVLPSFNDLRGGGPVNDPAARLLGPILRRGLVAWGRGRVHLLDGLDLGEVSSLPHAEATHRG